MLNTVHIPPPIPEVQGRLKNVKSGGRSSEKATDSPQFLSKTENQAAETLSLRSCLIQMSCLMVIYYLIKLFEECRF